MKPYQRRAAQRVIEASTESWTWIGALCLAVVAWIAGMPLQLTVAFGLLTGVALAVAPAVPALIRGQRGDGRFQIEGGVLSHPADRSDASTQYQMMERLTGTLERVRQLRDSPRLNDHVKDAAIEAYEAGKLAAEKGAALALAMDTFDRAIIDIAPDSASRHTNPESHDAVMRMERRRTAMEDKLRSTIESLSGVYTDLVETNATVTASGIVGAGQEQLEAISESLAELRDLVDGMEEGDLPHIEGA